MIIESLGSQRKCLLHEALLEAADFREPIFRSDTKLRLCGVEAHDRLSALERGLNTVLWREFAKNVTYTKPNVIRPLGYDETLAQFKADIEGRCKEIAENLYSSGFGRIEWLSTTGCKFDYPELHIQGGILKRKYTTLRHVHELVDARQHNLPALDVKRPAIVDRIISMIPKELHKPLRIVTGLEVTKGSAVESEEMRLTGFGKAVYGTRDAVVDGAQRVAAGVSKGAKAVGRVVTSEGFVKGGVITGGAVAATGLLAILAKAATAAAAVAIADPCLVLGDVVIVGWEN